MSKLNEKIKIIADNLCAPKNEILENVTLNLVNEYLQDAALKGYELCQKEYEEKLRLIPVEEKLPPENRTVLVKIKNEFCVALFRKGKFIQDVEFSDNDIVTHWRFL